ncbi:MAG: A24 family peptidase [Thermoanaerobaculia bacterium]|nr:A24 family peptidase [Thermoanaerobaculia bacterium]
MSLQLLVDLYLAVSGLLIGSYLNVVIHRLPREQSTVLPRSRCPHCGGVIRAYDNIPLISYLILRGHCRHCRAAISWRYPLIEGLTAICFVLSFEVFGVSWKTPMAILFCCLLIALAGIDAEHYILPDRITLPGAVVGLAIAFVAPWITWQQSALGILLGGGLLWAVAELWVRLRKVEGLGLGDVKMLAMVGAFLGWEGVVVTLFLGSLTGSLVGVTLMLRHRMNLSSRLPFGVFLSLGALIALFAGPWLLGSYGRLF